MFRWKMWILVGLLSFNLNAQMTGIYELGENKDFQSVEDFFTQLNNEGLEGNVTLICSPGVYDFTLDWELLFETDYYIHIDGLDKDSVVFMNSSEFQDPILHLNCPNLSLANLTFLGDDNYEPISLYGVHKLKLENINVLSNAAALYLETNTLDSLWMDNVSYAYDESGGQGFDFAFIGVEYVDYVHINGLYSAPLGSNFKELTFPIEPHQFGLILYAPEGHMGNVFMQNMNQVGMIGMVIAADSSINVVNFSNDTIVGLAGVQINKVFNDTLNAKGSIQALNFENVAMYAESVIDVYSSNNLGVFNCSNAYIASFENAISIDVGGNLDSVTWLGNHLFLEESLGLNVKAEGDIGIFDAQNNKIAGKTSQAVYELKAQSNIGDIKIIHDSLDLESGGLLNTNVMNNSVANVNVNAVYAEINNNLPTVTFVNVVEKANAQTLSFEDNHVLLNNTNAVLLTFQSDSADLNVLALNRNVIHAGNGLDITTNGGVKKLEVLNNDINVVHKALDLSFSGDLDLVQLNDNVIVAGSGAVFNVDQGNVKELKFAENQIATEQEAISLYLQSGSLNKADIVLNTLESEMNVALNVVTNASVMTNAKIANNYIGGANGVYLEAVGVSENVDINANVFEVDNVGLKTRNVSDLNVFYNQVKAAEGQLNVAMDLQSDQNNVGDLRVVANGVENVGAEGVSIVGFRNVVVNSNDLQQSLDNVGSFNVSVQNVGKNVNIEGNKLDLDSTGSGIYLRNVGGQDNVSENINVKVINNFTQGGLNALDAENVKNINVYNNSIYSYNPTEVIHIRSSENVNVRNNLLKADNVGNFQVMNVGDNVGMDINNNVYDVDVSANYNVNDNVHNDFQDYQNVSGQDNVSQIANIPFEDDWNNLRLDCASSLFNGANVNVNMDIDGFARSTQPTIGAHELNPVGMNVIKDDEIYLCQGNANVGIEGNVEAFSWSTGDTTRVINVETPGWVVLTASTSCNQVFKDSINVKAAAPLNVGFDVEVNNLEVQFFNLTDNVDNVMWYFGDGDSSNALNPTHVYADSMEYVVTLVVSTPCVSLDTNVIINPGINTEGEEESGLAEMNAMFGIFPNPSQGVLNFLTSEDVAVEVLDLTGKTVAHFDQIKNNTQVDLRHLNKGVYFVSFKGTHGQKVLKWRNQ